MGSVHPVGAPRTAGSWVSDRWVLAMQTGRLPQPRASKRSRASAAGASKDTAPAP